jgi:hypothetical protein
VQSQPFVTGFLSKFSESSSGPCETYMPVISFKQRNTKLKLETLDNSTQAGWADMAGFASAREIQGFCQMEE